MRKLYPLLLGSGLLLVAPAVLAQQAPATVTGDFRGLRFEQFVQRLEAQTPYRFYFNPATTDTIKVRVQATGQPLVAVLTQVLQPTGLSFALDEAGRRVFVTTGHPLQVQLPDSYFQPGSALGPPPALPDDAAVANQPALAGTSEFKLYEIGTRQAATTGKATLSGVVRLADTGQPAVGVAVYVENPSVGVATDRAGRYALSLPPGRYNVNIRGIGVRSSRRQVWLRGNGQLDLEVAPDAAVLKEVVVEGQRDRNVRSLQMGVQTLDIKTIKQVPTVFGEADILRVVMALPGVKTVGEGSTGMSVRGGGTDQNLVLYNDAVIYNPAHLFGFFSAFNPDVIKSVELYKSAIPVRYGGRLSSVLDIQGREGGRKKFGGSGGIGPLTSRLELEGPLGSTGDGTAKGSYIVGGRASYSDWLLHLVPNSALKNSAASFYDLNGSVTYDFNAHNSLYASGYYSRDRFRLASDTVYNYHNTAASLKWRHDFTDKLQAYFIGAYSNYDFGLSTTRNATAASTFDYSIKQVSGQANFNYLASAKHIIDFGGSSILYNTQPGNLQPLGEQSLLLPVTIQHERAVESALYASERFDISPRFSVQAGLRYSFFQALGPRTVTNYQDGLSRSESTATGTSTYGSGQVLAHYQGPEWRFSTRLELTAHSSVKASLTRMRQYIHQLTNTTVVSPTDSWKLSDNYIRPQVGDQVSLGYYHNFKRNTVEFSLEGYYKRTHDFLDYKSGAILLLNPHLETDLVNAEGRTYGVEMLLRKTEGKINGWLSYTYARSLVQINTPTDVVNGGAWYPSNYDKPHDVTLVGNYRFSRRFNLSLNFNYSTGRPITLPLAKYYVDQALRVYFSDRNAYRVPDYTRVDFAVNFEGNHKIEKLAHSSWTVAVYNLLGRRNPYSVYFQTVNGQIRGYKLSIFGEPIPTVTYNFRF